MKGTSGRFLIFLRWGFCVSILGAVLGALYPILRERASRPTCFQNMRILGLGLAMYVNDYDGVWPNERAWKSRMVSSRPLSGCPLVGDTEQPGVPGYAYNGFMRIRIDNSQIDFPQSSIAVCEEPVGVTFTYSANPYQSYPQEAIDVDRAWERHGGGGHYLFCDGHVEWLRLEQVMSSDMAEMGSGGVMPSFVFRSRKQVGEQLRERIGVNP